jgi:hypothetical protein
MKRQILCLVICLGMLAAATSASAVMLVLKQGVDGYTGCSDATVHSYYPTTNLGGDGDLWVWLRDQSPVASALVRFDLDGIIPEGSIIEYAMLSLYLNEVPDLMFGDYLTVGPYRVRDGRDWVESEATWDVFRADTVWTTAGCEDTLSDRLADPENSMTFYSTSPVGYYYTCDVTASVQAWCAGAENQGWLLRGVDQSNWGGKVIFASKDAASADHRPCLTIGFEAPVAVERTTWGGVKALFR